MKVRLTLIALLAANFAFAQIKLPQVSTPAEVEQTIGYTKIEVDYSRPNLNKRTAFGGELVPYGKLWRTGANTNTTFEVSTDVTIEGKHLAQGTYAIFVLPNAKNWDVIFYKKTDNWGTPEKLEDDLIALKVNVPTLKTKEKVETFTIGFKDAYIDKTTMFLAWDATAVHLNIKAKTYEMAEEVIKNELNANSSGYDYFSAAYYYYSNNLDLNKALEWINIAIEKDPKSTFFNTYKTKIEAGLKK